METARAEALAERIFVEMAGAFSLLSLYLGHRLGLFRVMSDRRPWTASQLAERTGFSERYVQEWLFAVASSDYIDADEAGTTFSLSEEHAAVLANIDSPFFLGAWPGVLQGSAAVFDQLEAAFRSGGGVDYAAYGVHLREGVAHTNRPMILHELSQVWIPAMAGMEARLEAGGRVADFGSGTGWASICMARRFPNITVHGIDSDPDSVREAIDLAAREGLTDRVTFHECAIEDLTLDERFDLVVAIECLHDMPFPVEALQRMREMLTDDGSALIADLAAGAGFSENHNSMGRLLFNVSLFHCLPQAMVQEGAAGTGAVLPEERVREFASQAGFASVTILNVENPFFRFYQLRR